MLLLTLICGIVLLLPKADTLTCHDCLTSDTGNCTKTTECLLNNQQCGATRVTTYAGQSQVLDLSMRYCMLPAQCIEGSMNVGLSKMSITTRCCDTDLCNSQPATSPSNSTPNGKKCYSCNGLSCTVTLNCEGTEDHCISTKMDFGGQKITMKGCASKLLCSDSAAQGIPNILEDGSCCQGDLCNTAIGTSASLLLLLVTPLVPLVMCS